jgi:hypothetical protein
MPGRQAHGHGASGRTAGRGGGGRGRGSSDGAAKQEEDPSWRRAAGSQLSGKSKKEYLRWKREQKRNLADESDDEDAFCPTAEDEAPAAAGQGVAAAVEASAAPGSHEQETQGESEWRSSGAEEDEEAGAETGPHGPSHPAELTRPPHEQRAAPDDRPCNYVPLVELPGRFSALESIRRPSH